MFNQTLRSLLLCFIVFCSASSTIEAQVGMPGEESRGGLGNRSQTTEPAKPTEYTIGGITVTGQQYIDEDLLLIVSGLSVGDKLMMPYDDKVSKALKNLWKQELFSDVEIAVSNIVADKIFLEIRVEERPRLSRYSFRGVKKSEAQELRDKVTLVRGKVVTEATKADAVNRIRYHYVDKGFGQVKVDVIERVDT